MTNAFINSIILTSILGIIPNILVKKGLITMQEDILESDDMVGLDDCEEVINEEEIQVLDSEESGIGAEQKKDDIIKCYRVGSLALTATTIVLCIIDLIFGISFASAIILLMSNRITTSVFAIKKKLRKRLFLC